MLSLRPTAEELTDLVATSQGREPADLFIRGGQVANVYSGEVLPQNVAVRGRRIAYVGPSEAFIGPDTTVIEAAGRHVVPGYIEPHAHPWIVYNPVSLAEYMVPLGTTALVYDSLPFLLTMGADGFQRFAQDLRKLPVRLLWSADVQPQSPLPNAEALFNSATLHGLIDSPDVVQIKELTHWPKLLKGGSDLLDYLAYARKLGKRVDGHTGGASYDKLNGLAAAGTDACHEGMTPEQVRNRLRMGMYVMLRHSSLRPDLRDLLPLLLDRSVATQRIMLTRDGPSPASIADKGGVDHLLSIALEEGLDPITALRMVTLNPATYFGLDQELGAVAPGRLADVLLLDDLRSPRPFLVVVNGRAVAWGGQLIKSWPAVDWNSYEPDVPRLERGRTVQPEWFMIPCPQGSDRFPVADLRNEVMMHREDVELPSRQGYLDISAEPGLVFGAVLDRHARWITNGIVRNFATRLDGLAASCTCSAQVAVLGSDPEAMAQAVDRLFTLGGGIVLVEDGQVLFEMPLTAAGVMSSEPLDTVAKRATQLAALLKERGHSYQDVIYTLIFFPWDVLPGLRITYAGLVDGRTGTVLRPRRELD